MAANAGPDIVEDGLVMYLDAGSVKSYPGSGTTWTDVSRTGNNATLTNGPTFNSSNLGSIVFDGTDDYGSITDNTSLYFPNTMSIQMFVKVDTIPPASNGNRMYIITKGDSSNYEWQTSINNFSSDFGKWCFLNYAGTSPGGALDGGSFRGRASNSNAVAGVWTNVAFVVTDVANPNDVYINGVLDNGSTLSQNTMYKSDGTSNVRLGTRNFGEKYLDGNLATVLIYNRALSAAEIAQNYNALKTRFGI